VLLFGLLAAVAATAGGAYLAWENRHAEVHLEAAGHVWTGHLYGVLLAGAVLAAWTIFGLSCIGLWRRERREGRPSTGPEPRANVVARPTSVGRSHDQHRS
jgi:hypothetical protein